MRGGTINYGKMHQRNDLNCTIRELGRNIASTELVPENSDEWDTWGLYPFSVNFIPLVGDYAGQWGVGRAWKGVEDRCLWG
jgi:hypothetical protein